MHGNGADKLSSAAKLLGKSAANVGMLTIEVGAEVIKSLPEHFGRKAQENLNKHSDLMTGEQIERANKAITLGDQTRERREEREKEEKEEKERERAEKYGTK